MRLRKLSTYFGVVILACSFCALLDVNSSLADQPSQGNELTAAIQKAYPQSKIVQAKDFDEVSCGVPPNPPGIVEADFNGDGQKDFMVLLRGGVEKEIEIEGKKYKSIEIKLIAFLKDGHGTYKSSIIYCTAPPNFWTVYCTLQAINFAESPVLFDAPFLKGHPVAFARYSVERASTVSRCDGF